MTRKIQPAAAAIACMALAAAQPCNAELVPLWEAGLGVGAISLPDYRGSDRSSVYALPVPYLVYRGDFLKADREGVRGTFLETDRLEINLSLNATLPVQSKDNPARAGMADLRPTVEVGPTLDATLWRSQNGKVQLDFRAPLRTAITVESSPRSIGWLFSPSLNIDVQDPAGMSGWNLGLLGGPVFSNRRYNNYFYSVSAQDATATRPAYGARGGYSGTQFTMALSKRFARYWVAGFLRYDTLTGAVFEESPLVKRRNAMWAGVAISWVLGESQRMVESGK